jgi:hypothetical protein
MIDRKRWNYRASGQQPFSSSLEWAYGCGETCFASLGTRFGHVICVIMLIDWRCRLVSAEKRHPATYFLALVFCLLPHLLLLVVVSFTKERDRFVMRIFRILCDNPVDSFAQLHVAHLPIARSWGRQGEFFSDTEVRGGH